MKVLAWQRQIVTVTLVSLTDFGNSELRACWLGCTIQNMRPRKEVQDFDLTFWMNCGKLKWLSAFQQKRAKLKPALKTAGAQSVRRSPTELPPTKSMQQRTHSDRIGRWATPHFPS